MLTANGKPAVLLNAIAAEGNTLDVANESP